MLAGWGRTMRIAKVEIQNFRGIRKLDWAPSRNLNCLIGPGDSNKTTILDAIELVLNPRTNYVAEETDIYQFNDPPAPASILLTVVELASEFRSDARYGLQLRGWDRTNARVVDEPGTGLEDALSIRVTIDCETLEGRWSIYNDRVAKEADPPSLRYSDARELATTRLGPYAERHLGWGRNSILTRIGDGAKLSAQLVTASRAAREAFRNTDKTPFLAATERAEKLGKKFAVAIRGKFAAELDIHGSAITSGGVTLHDDSLPLRTLGTGSSRLIVSALQHNAGGSHIALVDEIEHGLEPHRIARLLKYLRSPPDDVSGSSPQVFMTSHSPVVIVELRADDIHAVRSENGTTTVQSIEAAIGGKAAQRHLRASPAAFLARRVLVGEGKTECGLLRGLDQCWIEAGYESFAYQGAVAVSGGGIPNALTFAKHLVALGYQVLALLDTDKPPSDSELEDLKKGGCKILLWPDTCSVEQRIFLDVPWDVAGKLLAYAIECKSEDSIRDSINMALPAGEPKLTSPIGLPASSSDTLRKALGNVATDKDWFKDIERGEQIAALIFPALGKIVDKPLAKVLADARVWIDG
jgi:putative ATP-dependent endonuclease of OLD family